MRNIERNAFITHIFLKRAGIILCEKNQGKVAEQSGGNHENSLMKELDDIADIFFINQK